MPVANILLSYAYYKDIEELSVALKDFMEPRNIPLLLPQSGRLAICAV
jgi:hypothetical protein